MCYIHSLAGLMHSVSVTERSDLIVKPRWERLSKASIYVGSAYYILHKLGEQLTLVKWRLPVETIADTCVLFFTILTLTQKYICSRYQVIWEQRLAHMAGKTFPPFPSHAQPTIKWICPGAYWQISRIHPDSSSCKIEQQIICHSCRIEHKCSISIR